VTPSGIALGPDGAIWVIVNDGAGNSFVARFVH
jgi:hypothetical protein